MNATKIDLPQGDKSDYFTVIGTIIFFTLISIYTSITFIYNYLHYNPTSETLSAGFIFMVISIFGIILIYIIHRSWPEIISITFLDTEFIVEINCVIYKKTYRIPIGSIKEIVYSDYTYKNVSSNNVWFAILSNEIPLFKIKTSPENLRRVLDICRSKKLIITKSPY